MTQNDFNVTMRNAVQIALGGEVKVELVENMKNNGYVRKGLAFRGGEYETASPIIYLDEYYTQYSEHPFPLPELTERIVGIFRKLPRVDEKLPAVIGNFELMKKNLRLMLINTERNECFLKTVPHREFFDLSYICYLKLEASGFGTATTSVTDNCLRLWDISEDELFEIARSNMQDYEEECILYLSNLLYVVTNRTNTWGASIISKDNVLKEVYKQVGGSFYLIPSSIHEWLAVPQSTQVEKEAFKEMVRDVNNTVIEEKEILSYSVFFYNGNRMERIA